MRSEVVRLFRAQAFMNIRFSSESVNVCREGMCSCYKYHIGD